MSCALSAIDTTGLLRDDLGDIDELVDSIKTNLAEGLPALIHPIVLDSRMKLVSGSRRLEAHRRLNLPEIDYTLIGVLDDATRVRLEVDANKQKLFNWKEKVLGIDNFHRFYSTKAALNSESWGVRETGRLLRTGKTSVNRATFIAPMIRAGDPDILAAESLEDAYRILARRMEDELSKQLVAASKPKGSQNEKTPAAKREVGDEEFFTHVGTTGFAPGVTSPIDLDERPGGAVESASSVTVPLSKMFLHGDAVATCKTFPAETFDAVITDWPYAEDMKNIQQAGGGKDVSTTAAEHTVEGNRALQLAIVPELYRILKPDSWFVTFADVSLDENSLQHLAKLIATMTTLGFKVQRWANIWHKTSICQNMAAQYNFTKNYESVIVCRKGSATLLRPQASCVWQGGSDAETRLLGHPFAKPAGLWEWILNATCLRGATILDPFVGSGSSIIPMVRMGMKPMGIESSEQHYGTLMVNMQNFYKSLDPRCTFS